MCGISGFIDFRKNTSSDVVVKMKDALSHRGPDDSDIFFKQNDLATIGLGHNRLSIIDLSPLGHQPMKVDDLTIVFNGEIYNYEETRNKLIADGVSFKSHSDTEVILRAFQKWGIRCIDNFRGMFAFVIYDEANQKIWMVRDRVGVKPLYFYHHDGLILFASELKSFHQHPRFKKNIDLGSLALFLTYSYLPGPHSIFENVKKLEPAHYLEISLRDQTVKNNEYWSVIDCYNQPTLDISEEEALRETEKVLTESFNYRMVADVPVGVFLSGGFDSSAVASLLQKDRKERLKTFTIGFDVTGFDEAPEARKVAKHLGTDHTEYYCKPEDALAIIPRLPEIYDEPFADNSSVPSVLVSQLARKSVTVALSGDGGDEIFAGYGKFNQSLKFSGGWSGGKKVLSGAMGLVNPEHVPYFRSKYNFATRYEKMRLIFGSNNASEVMKIIAQYIPHTEVRKLLRGSYPDLKTSFDINGELKNNDALARLLAVDYITFLVDNNLTKMDRATMSVALEGREPFLDQKVIELVAHIPSELKIKDGVNKYLLKQIVYKYLPKEMMDRPKKPFIAPLSVWFMKQLKDFFFQYLDGDRLKKEGYFNPEPIVKMRDQFLAGTPISHQKLWNLLMFQMWHERWMK